MAPPSCPFGHSSSHNAFRAKALAGLSLLYCPSISQYKSDQIKEIKKMKMEQVPTNNIYNINYNHDQGHLSICR